MTPKVLANLTAVAARGYSRAGIDKEDIRFAFEDRTNWPPCRTISFMAIAGLGHARGARRP